LEGFFKNFIALATLIIVHTGTNTSPQHQYEESLTSRGKSNIIQLSLPSAQRIVNFLCAEGVPGAEFISRLSAQRGKSAFVKSSVCVCVCESLTYT
jgi:hypothetical protein